MSRASEAFWAQRDLDTDRDDPDDAPDWTEVAPCPTCQQAVYVSGDGRLLTVWPEADGRPTTKPHECMPPRRGRGGHRERA